MGNPDQPRPLSHLHAATRLYPNMGKRVEEFIATRGKDLPDWPAWCFLPLAGWYAIVSEDVGQNHLSPTLVGDVARLAAIGTWRYSQGIYRFDKSFREAISETTISGEIPCDVLYRLPEWSVYIETPGMDWLGDRMYGFWSHLEFDTNNGRHELRLLLDCENGLIPIPLHLGPWTLTEAVDRMFSEAEKQIRALGVPPPGESDMAVQTIGARVNPLLSLVLYLCSEEPDIEDREQPGTTPAYPAPKKTKRGWRLFPANNPRVWEVGQTFSAKLHRRSKGATDRKVAPHLRRAHWHGYWRGPKDGEREFFYRWIPPVLVAGGDTTENEDE